MGVLLRQLMQFVQGKRFLQGFFLCSTQKGQKLLLQDCKLLRKGGFSGQLQHGDPVQEQGAEEAVHRGGIIVGGVLFRRKSFDCGAVFPYDGD